MLIKARYINLKKGVNIMKKIFKISLLLVATLLSACRSSSSSEHSEKLVPSSSEKTSEITSSSSESSSSTAFRILDTVKNICIENNYLSGTL
jgi:uncharacterized protein YcfL